MKEERKKYSLMAMLIILFLSFLIYFFINVSYNNKLISMFMALVFLIISILAYRRSVSLFTLFLLTSISMFLALGVSFSSLYTGDSPISIKIILGPWVIFFISLVFSLSACYLYERSRYKNKFPFILLIVYIILWLILSINVKYFEDWKMENYLTVPFVLLLFITFKRFRLSNLSYTLIFVYMTLHIIGTHYTYSEVPFGFWLQGFLNLPRNHYDRIVHFSFGLLLAYPVREIAVRIANLKGVWSLYFPIDFVLAFSAIYELIEWGIAVIFGGDLGVAYLGTQGDIWDAQKDMFLAFSGSVLAMLTTSIVIWYYNSQGFIKEIRESLTIKSREVLGEKAIEKFLKKKSNNK